jgi:chorismate mutase
MADKQLREDLERLRAEISNLEPDSKTKEKLTRLLEEIEQEIDESSLEDVAKSVLEKVEKSVYRFETSHPTVTGILNNIMVTLSNIGV